MKLMWEEPLGIESSGYDYIQMPEGLDNLENHLNEYDEINKLLKEAIYSNRVPEFQSNSRRLQFINWGDTELVYVLTTGNRKYTLLVGQPTAEFGTVKKEYDNLQQLYKRNPDNVVSPMYYFKNSTNTKELYVTPYLYQARCIAGPDMNWGIFIPEPEYHFKEFSKSDRRIVNSTMIALLIKMFDSKNNLGIASCNISRGGDFILEKGKMQCNDEENFTYEDILKRIKLIAAREFVSMGLDEYIDTIRREFVQETYFSESGKKERLIINQRSCCKMDEEEIESGIKYGKILREREKTEVIK